MAKCINMFLSKEMKISFFVLLAFGEFRRGYGGRDCKSSVKTNEDEETVTIQPREYPANNITVLCVKKGQNYTAYIALKHPNYGESPGTTSPNCDGNIRNSTMDVKPGKTVFKKIAIDLDTLTVDEYNFDYTEQTGEFRQAYGHAYNCYTNYEKHPSCGHPGTFEIDLRDTGLKIHPNQKWSESGEFRKIDEYFLYGRQKLILKCGGYCGGCTPSKGLKLRPKTVNGNWGEWRIYSRTLCKRTCTTVSTDDTDDTDDEYDEYETHETYNKTQGRECNSPEKDNDGLPCSGESRKSLSSIPCELPPCPVLTDGAWSTWVKANESKACTVSCGKGSYTINMVRECNDPAPQLGGKQCTGDRTKNITETCVMGNCPGGSKDDDNTEIIIAIILVVLLLLIAAGVAYYIARRRKNQRDPTSPIPSSKQKEKEEIDTLGKDNPVFETK